MSDVREAGSVVTSENLAEFHAQKLGLAVDDAPNEAEESEPLVEAESQSDTEAENESEVTEKPKANPKLEKRFSELTKQREQARQEAAAAKADKEALENRIRELEGRSNPVKKDVSVLDEPQPSQFNDAFEYAKALAEYSTEKALSERDRQDAERIANSQREKVIDTWTKRLDAAKASLPDFDDMVQSADVAVSNDVRDAILESEVGPQVLYHLAENPEFAKSLSEMTTQKSLRELGKLEARFEVKDVESKPVAVKSKAPAPINPLKASSSGIDVKMDTNGVFHGTYQQYKEARKAGKIR